MTTPSSITGAECGVVRTEMAAVCIHLTSAFLAASCLEDTTTTGENEDAEDNLQTDEQQQQQQISNREQITVAYLENQLISMTKLGLPADYRLKELRAVAEGNIPKSLPSTVRLRLLRIAEVVAIRSTK
ncbi:unnamed protein product [Trichobilharzia regenti]|nr:unnamed protein product [Trichobilharzia regenti]